MSGTWEPLVEDRRDYHATRGERDTVLTYLRNYRAVFEMKLEGLDAEQLARRSVPPSTMSLLGLLRHLAQVEHSWNKRMLQQQPDLPRPYWSDDDRDLDFNGAVADDEVVADAWRTWRQEVADADAWLAAEQDWSRLVPVHGEDTEVRDIAVHLVEEYARHVGHADLLRECIDGRTGQ
jgi:uncharacterized damage-inducible protein DinB